MQNSSPLERPWVIYTLVDPRDGCVRYVGWTTNPKTRFRDHLKPSRAGCGQQRRDRWIRSVLADGYRPTMEIIERGTGEWADREIHWIAHYRGIVGKKLTNTTLGGEGALGRRHTDAAKKAMSKKRKGKKPSAAAIAAVIATQTGAKRTPEHRAKISAALKGKPKSPEHRAKLSAAKKGIPLSEEQRERSRQVLVKLVHPPLSAEQKRAMSDARKGKPNPRMAAFWASLTPTERSERARAQWAKMTPAQRAQRTANAAAALRARNAKMMREQNQSAVAP